MSIEISHATSEYRIAMGRLLVMYTQIDRLIMEICAERIATAPDQRAKLGLAKQVGDESRHVMIQQEWMAKFGTSTTPVFTPAQEAAIRAHFRNLPWMEFLADMYVCVEALGSEAVEQIVPIADPGTRASLRTPLADELDHVAFGVGRLKEELLKLSAEEREAFIVSLEGRIERMTRRFHEMGLNVAAMFEAVGADYAELGDVVIARRSALLQEIAAAA
jgi:hypothetical protein